MPDARRKVLHILGSLNRGGAETWLMHVLHHINRERFQVDFLVHTTEHGAYEDEVKALGSKVFVCAEVGRPHRYAQKFRQIVRQESYHVIHSHVHHFSGVPLFLARTMGVPVRIAHSHLFRPYDPRLVRRAYFQAMRSLIAASATCGLAASHEAAVDLFGAHWQDDARWRIFYCAIDLKPFQETLADPDLRGAVRTELNIPQDAFVVGHVGRFDPQKNHRFIVEIAAETCRRLPPAHFLLVGDGPLRPEIESRVAQLGLSDRVHFTGARADVPHLMRSFDAFILPSLFEGLGLVCVEAQAAGVPTFISDGVPQEASLIPALIQTIRLAEAPAAWAEALVQKAALPSPVSAVDALDIVTRSPFNIETTIGQLEQIYYGDTHA